MIDTRMKGAKIYGEFIVKVVMLELVIIERKKKLLKFGIRECEKVFFCAAADAK